MVVTVSLFLVSLVVSLMEDFTLNLEDTESLIPSNVMVEISPSSNHPKSLLKPIIFKNPLIPSKVSKTPVLERLHGRNTLPKDQVLCGKIEPMLDCTFRPPRPTGLFVFSGGIHHRSRPFLPIQHSRFRYLENLTPEQIQAGTGVFIPRVPIPPPSPRSAISARRTTACAAGASRGLCRTVVVHAKLGKKHLIRNNGGETSNKWEKKKDDDYFPDELLSLEICLPEDWTY